MSRKILIIDDDQELCSEMAETLKAEGYLTHSVFDGTQAFEHIKNNAYEIIILDYKIPGMNSIEIFKLIKSLQNQVRVYITSGLPFLEQLLTDEKIIHQVNGYIAKPFDAETLLAMLAASLVNSGDEAGRGENSHGKADFAHMND